VSLAAPDAPEREEETVQGIKLVAVILIVAGILALVYGGFSFTKESHRAHVGPFDFSFQEKEHVNVPVWAGVAAIVVGAGMLLTRRPK
jgi:TRAP-type C4-dicarboxylate transport system permease small subunit